MAFFILSLASINDQVHYIFFYDIFHKTLIFSTYIYVNNKFRICIQLQTVLWLLLISRLRFLDFVKYI